MIREATDEDIEGIIDLLKEAWKASPVYSKQGYAEVRTAAFLAHLLDNPKAVVLVNEGISAVLAAEIVPNWTGLGWTAYTHVIYSRPGKGGLQVLRAYKEWASEWPQVTKVMISTSFGGDDERTEKLFNRLGFEPVGRTYLEVSP